MTSSNNIVTHIGRLAQPVEAEILHVNGDSTAGPVEVYNTVKKDYANMYIAIVPGKNVTVDNHMVELYRKAVAIGGGFFRGVIDEKNGRLVDGINQTSSSKLKITLNAAGLNALKSSNVKNEPASTFASDDNCQECITAVSEGLATIEAERLEAERVEAARIEAERLEAERVEAARIEAERLEAARIEAERVEAERLEAERVEAERLEAERIEAERVEAERLEAERIEAERLEAERVEAERLEAERVEAERIEAARVEAERLEVERVEAERLEEGLVETAVSNTDCIELAQLGEGNSKFEAANLNDAVAGKTLEDRLKNERINAFKNRLLGVGFNQNQNHHVIVSELAEDAVAVENEKHDVVASAKSQIEQIEKELLDSETSRTNLIEAALLEAKKSDDKKIELQRVKDELERLEKETAENERIEAERLAEDAAKAAAWAASIEKERREASEKAEKEKNEANKIEEYLVDSDIGFNVIAQENRNTVLTSNALGDLGDLAKIHDEMVEAGSDSKNHKEMIVTSKIINETTPVEKAEDLVSGNALAEIPVAVNEAEIKSLEEIVKNSLKVTEDGFLREKYRYNLAGPRRAVLSRLRRNSGNARGKTAEPAELVDQIIEQAQKTWNEKNSTDGLVIVPEVEKPEEVRTFHYKGRVRSGAMVTHSGDVVIEGAIGSCGEVVAGGDIHVYGVAGGRLMAGVNGDTKACIYVQDFDAELISIAGQYVVSEDIPSEWHGKQVRISLDEDDVLQFEPIQSIHRIR